MSTARLPFPRDPRDDLDRADVVDLRTARVRRSPDHNPDTDTPQDATPDNPADAGPGLGPISTTEAPLSTTPPEAPSRRMAVTDIPVKSLRQRAENLLPVVPRWLHTAEARRATLRWWVHVQWHLFCFHTFRSPKYAGKAMGRSVRGTWRLARRLVCWALDTRADTMEQELAMTRLDAREFLRVREDRSRRIRARLIVTGLGLVAAFVLAVVLSRQPWPVQVGVALVLLVGLVRVGGNEGNPLLGQAMAVSNGYRILTDKILLRALNAAGLGGKVAKDETEEDTTPTLAQPIARDGAGYLATIDLPFGKTVTDAAKAKDKLASGLDVEDVQVFVENVKGSSRRVAIWVSDVDPFSTPPRRSPLARLPKSSVWEPTPLGMQPRGQEMRPTLLFNSFLVGAIPRMGKTFAARVLAGPGLLDPHCDVSVLDFKGGRDWGACGSCAVTYRSGDEEEDLEYGMTVLERITAEARARFKEFRTLSDADCPQSKLTPQLARRGMYPHLLVIDEVQNLLTHPEFRKDALRLLVWLAKTAPAAGYSLLIATQRPAVEVIPADLRDNTSVRLALRTMTWRGSDAILGDGASSIGWSTASFLSDHQGAAILRGVPNGRGGDFSTIRTDLLTDADFTRICQMGRQRRLDAGTLRGSAAGEADDIAVEVSVLSDVLAVWPNAEPKVQAVDLVERLERVHPDRYSGLDAGSLTKALKAHGVGVVQVFRDGSNRNGYTLDSLRRAAERGRLGGTAS